MKVFIPFIVSLALANDEASYTDDVGGLFRTMEEHPERVHLSNIDGNVPEWLKGSMFRNGPGQYEYGTDHFRHIFDPSAIIKKIEFDNGNVHYQVRTSRTFSIRPLHR
jgi:carotenoid cleavage dioxygenase-like enzyme